MDDSRPAVRANHLFKIFGPDEGSVSARLHAGEPVDLTTIRGTAAVVDANFEVAPGETFVVMGLSGSGKSTLIRMLNGLNRPTAGSVEINGLDITNAPRSELRRVRRDEISMVFQHFALLPHRTVEANVMYGLAVKKAPKDVQFEEARRWMDIVGLGDVGQKYPDQLSGGMRQRVGLARALATGSDILLMDEAFSALDPLIRTDLQAQLMELQEDLGKTIIFITHDLNEAMRLGNRVAVMREGRIVQIGTAPQLITQPADDYIARFIADVDRSRVLTAGMIADNSAPLTRDPKTPAGQLATEMADREHTVALVVDRDTRPLGVLLLADAQAEPERSAGDLMVTERPIQRLTPIADLFARAANQTGPLVIVDRQGRAIGLVTQDRLLDAMSSTDLTTAGTGASR